MEATQDIPLVVNGRKALATLSRDRLMFAAVLAIVGLALGLRLYGLGWDEGYDWTPHPDERAILQQVDELSPPSPGDLGSLLDADESPWNPQWFPYGSFPLYLLKGVQLVYSALPGLHMDDLRIPGRAISALADTATVAVVLLLGTRVYGRRVGILASGLTALAVLHIQLSHFYAVDTLLALFAVVALYFMYKIATEGRPRDSTLAGVFIALGLATKLSMAPIMIPFFGAHLMYALAISGREDAGGSAFATRWPRALKGAAVGIGAILAIGFIVEPYAFLDRTRFVADFTEQSEMVRRIRDYPYTRQYADTLPYWYHIRQLATWGMGWPLGLVAWGGLLFVALRGMRLPLGLIYLAGGWAVPALMLLASNGVIVILLASGIAFAALLATLPLRSRESRADVLLLMWVVPYFLIIGALEVKFLRYLIPITPFLILFGTRMLMSIWDVVGTRLPSTRPLLVGGVIAILGATGLYALSYVSIYGEPHTAVRASQWIGNHVPQGSVILKEHWEESLPDLYGYNVRELPMYEFDRPAKFELIARELADAHYLVLFSNRLYGTLPRLPERYPVSAEYYRLLFTGALGYELVNYERSYPSLLGVSLVDDTFRRPDVPEPRLLAAQRPSIMTLGMGFADESFTVYDHPKVLVFENRDGLSAEVIFERIYGDLNASPSAGRAVGLLMSSSDAEAQRSGGTWTDIVDKGGWTGRMPVVAWLMVIEGMSLLTLPIGFVLFRALPDRGFLFTKILGLLLVCLIVWLLASLHWMAFSRASVTVAMVAVGAVSLAILVRRRDEIVDFVRRRWSILLVGEVLFLTAFLIFIALRMANPDLWHPFRGGEKPMDFAYLNAVLRSSYMPPYDPWFAGGYINYYYWGQFVVATLIHATGIAPATAFNLAVPTLFALTAGAAFALVYNMAEATLRRRSSQVSALPSRRGLRWSPVLAGLGGFLFVTVIGNLDGAVQVGQGAWRALFQNMPFGGFDFWRSSRMMAPDPPGFEINEFPFFSFLFADLHAHLVALPFTLLVLGLGLALILGASRRARSGGVWTLGEMSRLAALGVAVGSLRALNTWDYPTYLIIAAAVVILAVHLRYGGVSLASVAESAAKLLFVGVIGGLVFLPFLRNYETFFTSLETTTNLTVLWQFLAIHGLFIFIIGSFFIARLWPSARPVLIRAWRRPWGGSTPARVAPAIGLGVIVTVVGGLGYLIATWASVPAGSTIPFVSILLLALLPLSHKWLTSRPSDTPLLAYTAIMIGVALALVFGLDLWRVEGDIDRMNSVFKFYLQVWVLLAVASAYLLWRMLDGWRRPTGRVSVIRRAWITALAVLILSASVYPVLGTQDRLRDRFNNQTTALTLDGEAYVEQAVYRDRAGSIDLAADFEGIEWLREHVQGSPVVLEGVTPTYRWGGRVSVYTGLPSVMGWQWHQEQQRWDYRWVIAERMYEVDLIYGSGDAVEALRLLRKHGVEYVYLGQVERLYYPPEGLAKFDGALSEHLQPVFDTDEVTIYRVRGLD